MTYEQKLLIDSFQAVLKIVLSFYYVSLHMCFFILFLFLILTNKKKSQLFHHIWIDNCVRSSHWSSCLSHSYKCVKKYVLDILFHQKCNSIMYKLWRYKHIDITFYRIQRKKSNNADVHCATSTIKDAIFKSIKIEADTFIVYTQ